MKRILLITTLPPWPPHVGGRQRTNLLYRALSERGRVDLVLVYIRGVLQEKELAEARRSFNLLRLFEWDPKFHHPLGRLVGRVHAGLGAKIDEALSPRGWDYAVDQAASAWLAAHMTSTRYDLVVGRYLNPVAKADAFRYRPMLLDVDDVDYMHLQNDLETPGHSWRKRWMLRLKRDRVRRQFDARMGDCDHVFTASERDVARIDHPSVSALPNIPYVAVEEPMLPMCAPRCDSKVVLVVGLMTYRPNREGMARFLANVWPDVYRKCPEAKLKIVGAVRDKERATWENVPGVEVCGFVDDLREAYAEAAFTVAPVYFGAGTKIKVLESLAYGRTCVVTTHAHYGYESTLQPGVSLMRADSDDEMSACCVELLNNARKRDALAAAGHAVVKEPYTFDRFRRVVLDAVDAVCAAG